MRTQKKTEAAPAKTGSRYADLKTMLDDRRRELQAEVQGKMRGVREENSRTVTTFWRGNYTDEPALRQDFLSLVRS